LEENANVQKKVYNVMLESKRKVFGLEDKVEEYSNILLDNSRLKQIARKE
jgi:hypothetical protein